MFSTVVYASEESVINAVVAARTRPVRTIAVFRLCRKISYKRFSRSREYSNHEKASEFLTASY